MARSNNYIKLEGWLNGFGKHPNDEIQFIQDHLGKEYKMQAIVKDCTVKQDGSKEWNSFMVVIRGEGRMPYAHEVAKLKGKRVSVEGTPFNVARKKVDAEGKEIYQNLAYIEANEINLLTVVTQEQQSVSTQSTPVQSVSTQQAPVQTTSVQPVLTQQTPVQPTQTQQVPVQATPVQSVSTQQVPMQTTPVQPVLTQQTPVQSTPVQQVPIQQVQETPPADMPDDGWIDVSDDDLPFDD